MARRPKDKASDADMPGADHNQADTDEQALLLHHFNKLRAQEKVMEEARAAYDAEKSAMTGLFRIAKVDKFTRKELQALLDDSKSLRRDLVAEEERRAKLRAWIGLPAGTQLDLFRDLPLETQDEQYAEGQGYTAGLRGDVCEAPEGMQPRHIPAFTRGWHSGQEKVIWAMAEAGKIVDRKPDASAMPVNLEPEPDPEDVIKAGVKNLKASGFMEPGADVGADQPETVAA